MSGTKSRRIVIGISNSIPSLIASVVARTLTERGFEVAAVDECDIGGSDPGFRLLDPGLRAAGPTPHGPQRKGRGGKLRRW